MTLLGRAVLAGRWGLGQQFIAGWGCLCIVLTVWGVFTSASLKVPAIGFTGLAVGALFFKSRMGAWREDLDGLWRFLLLAIPLLWVMADVDVSQLDVFNLMLPNTAYLFDHNHFPTLDGPSAFSDLPVAPYNTEIVPYLGAIAGGGFAANSLSLFTLLLHVPAALLFAKLIAGQGRQPQWFAISFGFALATLINPGFVPRISFSGMGEAPVAITLLFSGWLIAEALEELAAGIRWPSQLLPLSLTLVAMINVKQQAIGIFVSIAVAAILVSAVDRRIGWRKGCVAFGAAILPAVSLFLLWRGYVLLAYPSGELKPLALEFWAWHMLPQILKRVGTVLLEKGYFLASVLVLFYLWVFPRNWMKHATRNFVALASLTVLFFNGYLLVAYVGHFSGEHSYFRYNTEVTLFVDAALLLSAQDVLAAYPYSLPRLKVAVTAALVLVMTISPVIFEKLLRFDRDMPQPRARFMVEKIAPELKDHSRIAILLPEDNENAKMAVGALLRFGGRQHPILDIDFSASAEAADFDRVAQAGYSLALVSCTNKSMMRNDLPPDSAALFALSEGHWKPVQVWTYPQAPARSKWGWTRFMAQEPFCLD